MGFLSRAVLTLDVVNFSLVKPDQKQLEVIQTLIQMLRHAIPKEHNHPNAIIWSPAGDGGSLTFLEDNIPALETALSLGRLVKEHNAKKDVQPFQLRMGIHLGTVTKETDFDDRVNVWGEGVNISARITGLARPGQILVSEDFYKATALEARPEGEVASIGKWWAKHHKPIILYNVYRDGVGIPPSEVEEWYGPFHYPLQQATDMYTAMLDQQTSTGPAFRVAVLAKRLLDLEPRHKHAEEVLKSLSINYSRFAKTPLYDRFFSDLSPNSLVYFFRNAEFGDFPKNKVIANEGEPADSLMMVVSGEVIPTIRGERLHGSSAEDVYLREGDIIGEMGLFNPGGKRTATLVASKNTITLTLNYRFLRILDNAAHAPENDYRLEIQKQIWKSYCERTTHNKISLHPLFKKLPNDERNKLLYASAFFPTEPGLPIQMDVDAVWNCWTVVVAGKVTVYAKENTPVEYYAEDCLGPIRLIERTCPFSRVEFAPDTQIISLPWTMLQDLTRTFVEFRKDCIFAGDEDRARFGLT